MTSERSTPGEPAPGGRIGDDGENRERTIRYLLTRTGNRPDAEDLAQNALLTILANGTTRDNWQNLDLLFRVSLNELRNHQRTTKSRRRYSADWNDAVVDRIPGENGRDADITMDIKRALSRMTTAERHLLFDFWEGFTIREMADVLGVGVPAVRKQLAHAKRKFVAEMEGYESSRVDPSSPPSDEEEG